MNLGSIFSPRAVDNASSKQSDYAESSSATPQERFGVGESPVRTRVDLRSIVQRRFMNMIEVHDRVRARVLGLSSPGGHAVSGD